MNVAGILYKNYKFSKKNIMLCSTNEKINTKFTCSLLVIPQSLRPLTNGFLRTQTVTDKHDLFVLSTSKRNYHEILSK